MKTRFRIGCLMLAAIVLSAFAFESCATLKQMAEAMSNLKRLQFKLGEVHGFRLAGIDLSGKTRLNQFSALDALALVQAFRAKNLPADFVLEVMAVNPNDGTGGGRQTTSTLTSLEARLLIDGKPTVVGNIERPIEIPGTGQASVVPIRLSLDLFAFFGEKQYEDVINLALAIGGAGGSASRLSLDAQPRVDTPIGPIAYPGRIVIVDKEFR